MSAGVAAPLVFQSLKSAVSHLFVAYAADLRDNYSRVETTHLHAAAATWRTAPSKSSGGRC